MADFGMFGAPVGIRQGEIDQQAIVKNLLDAQETLGKIAMQPYEMQRTQAQAQLYGAQANAAQAKAREDQALQEITQRAASQVVQGTSVLEMADRVAREAASAGYMNRALDIAKDSTTVRQHVASADASVARATLNKLKTQGELAGRFAAILGQVKTAEDWDTANALFTLETNKESPYAGLPYDPELVRRIRDGQLSVKESAELQAKKVQQEHLDAFRQRRLAQHDTANAISAGRARLAAQREARLAKDGGGKEISGPSKTGIALAKNLIKSEFPEFREDATQLDAAATTVAARARALMRANKALDEATAVQQAFTEERAAKSFEVEKPTRILGFDVGKGSAKFNWQGREPSKPLAMPPSKDKAIKGRYYQLPDGKVYLWTGTGFKPTEAERPLSDNNSRPAPAAADDDDDGDED